MNRGVITIILMALYLSPSVTHARCPGISLNEAFREAEAVIEAEVIEYRPSAVRGWKEARLKTKTVWKKGKTSTGTILDFAASPEKPPLSVGNVYLLFLDRPIHGKLVLGKCSPQTRELPIAEQDIAELKRLTNAWR